MALVATSPLRAQYGNSSEESGYTPFSSSSPFATDYEDDGFGSAVAGPGSPVAEGSIEDGYWTLAALSIAYILYKRRKMQPQNHK